MIMEKKEKEKKKNPHFRRKCFQKIGGFDLISRRPMIDPANQQLFVVSGRNIRQYSTETGSFQRDFTFENKSDIISLSVNPANAKEYIVVDEDGLLVHWNFVDNVKTNEVYLPLNGKKINFFQQVYDDYYFVVPTKNGNSGQLFYSNRLCLNQQYMAICKNDFINPGAHQSVCFGPTEQPKYCATIFENQLMVYEIPVKVKSLYKKHVYDSKMGKTLTCVAFHPTEECLATGDSKGMIAIWNGLLQQSPTRAIFHWHSQQVNDLSFSISGTHLYSCGNEMTLVKWNLVGQDYGKKDFLPRLGQPIKLISMDDRQEFIVCSLEDQSMVIVDGQMNSANRIIEGLTNGIDDENGKLLTGLHYSVMNKALVMNGRVGHLQFYSPSQQKLICQLDIANQNVVSAISTKTERELEKERRLKKSMVDGDKETDNKKLIQKLCPIKVTNVSVSDKGDWMASIEFRDDGKAFVEQRLKFWRFEGGKFHLVTLVQLPHLDEIIFTSFSPKVPSLSSSKGSNLSEEDSKELHFVTCSMDGTFQVWDLELANNRREGWSSEKVGNLDGVSIPRFASFSHDSTLLAVVFGETITLWKNSKKGLELIPRSQLSHLNTDNRHQDKNTDTKILMAKFGIGFKTYFFLLVTNEEVRVFDALKGFNLVYSYKAPEKEVFLRADFDMRNNVLALISEKYLRFVELNRKSQELTMTIPLTSEHYFVGKVVGTCFGNEVIDDQLKVFHNLEFYLVNDKSEVYHTVQISGGERLEKYQSTIRVPSEENSGQRYLMAQIHSSFESELSKVISAGRDTDSLSDNENRDKNRKRKDKKSSSSMANRFNLARSKLVETFFDSVPTHVLPEPGVFDEPYLEALNKVQGDFGDSGADPTDSGADMSEEINDLDVDKVGEKAEVVRNNRLESRFYGVEWL